MATLIYKILTADQWTQFDRDGVFKGAPVDLADGYIHLSKAEQARETAKKHFAGRDGLMLVAVDADALGDALTYEVSRGGALFPHLYGDLDQSSVIWTKPMPLAADGTHVFPDGFDG